MFPNVTIATLPYMVLLLKQHYLIWQCYYSNTTLYGNVTTSHENVNFSENVP